MAETEESIGVGGTEPPAVLQLYSQKALDSSALASGLRSEFKGMRPEASGGFAGLWRFQRLRLQRSRFRGAQVGSQTLSSKTGCSAQGTSVF